MLKIYPSLDATIAVQDYGTAWHMILRGPPQEVEWLFNSCFNFGATNENHVMRNHCQTEAYFFSSKARMVHFFTQLFRNRYVMQQGMSEENAAVEAAYTAIQTVEDLWNNHREARQQYKTSICGGEYGFGKIKAINPDDSFKDVVWENAEKIGLASIKNKPKELSEGVEDIFSELQGA